MSELELFAYPITGLYDECHHIDYGELISARAPTYAGPHSLRNLNNLWWKHATSEKTLNRITAQLSERCRLAEPESAIHRIVKENPALFVEMVQCAVKNISNLRSGPKGLFSALETLQIFCNLYSDFISYPYRLSLQEGILMNELDTRILVREALDAARNPYLNFLTDYAKPIIETANADILWLVGPPKSSLFTMALMQRALNPRCHISIIGHSTEYYSLNKITHLLEKNDLLFRVIDSIVLDDFENTIPQLRDAVFNQDSLASVPNLMFRDRNDRITTTGFVKNSLKTIDYNSSVREVSSTSKMKNTWVDASEAVTTKLWPNAKCFWSSCNFCAINKKYNTLPANDFSSSTDQVEFFERISQLGHRYLWSIDEAIPPENLDELAIRLISDGNLVHWETRSKIHQGFTEEVCKRLYESGLREIRLGLESASPRVLEAMGKHSEGWTTSLVEEIVSNFHKAGISVHFPSIIGFPSETKEERQETYDFFKKITHRYPSVTFNINILGMDVASKLFKAYEKFGVTEIRWPCNPAYFLGNLIDWNSTDEPFIYEALDAERNYIMRELLYSWMPRTATLPVYIFYRLAETSRSTLIWKSVREERGDWSLSDLDHLEETSTVTLSEKLVCAVVSESSAYNKQKRYVIYDWQTHHQIEVDEKGLASVELFRKPISLKGPHSGEFDEILRSLYDMGLLVPA